LRLRWRAVDLVGQQDVGKDRPFDEAELAAAGFLFFKDRRAVMSVGIRSGVN
jgi:hypothetical protein